MPHPHLLSRDSKGIFSSYLPLGTGRMFWNSQTPAPAKFIPSSHLYWSPPNSTFPCPWPHCLPLWPQGHQLPTRFAPFCEGATSLSLAWVPFTPLPQASCPSPSQDAWGAERHEHAMVTLDQRGMNRWHPSFPHRMFWDLFCGFCRRPRDTEQREATPTCIQYWLPRPCSPLSPCTLLLGQHIPKKPPPTQASHLGSTLGYPSLDPSPSGWTCISKVEWEHDSPHFQEHVLQWAFQTPGFQGPSLSAQLPDPWLDHVQMPVLISLNSQAACLPRTLWHLLSNGRDSTVYYLLVVWRLLAPRHSDQFPKLIWWPGFPQAAPKPAWSLAVEPRVTAWMPAAWAASQILPQALCDLRQAMSSFISSLWTEGETFSKVLWAPTRESCSLQCPEKIKFRSALHTMPLVNIFHVDHSFIEHVCLQYDPFWLTVLHARKKNNCTSPKFNINFFFGHATWLAGSQFPNEGLNPGHASESAKSNP